MARLHFIASKDDAVGELGEITGLLVGQDGILALLQGLSATGQDAILAHTEFAGNIKDAGAPRAGWLASPQHRTLR